MTQDTGASASQTGLSQAEPEEVSALRASIPSADTPTAELFAMLRREVSLLAARAYGTQPGWARYTIVGELVEMLAARRVPGKRIADLVSRLRSPDYRITSTTLNEAADKLEAFDASAIEARRAATGNTDAVHESAVAESETPKGEQP